MSGQGKPYDLRMGGSVGTVAGVPDVDGNTIPVGFDFEAVTVGHYRFGPGAVTALMAAIVSGSLEAAKAADALEALTGRDS